jgi:hypothetical protein
VWVSAAADFTIVLSLVASVFDALLHDNKKEAMQSKERIFLISVFI